MSISATQALAEGTLPDPEDSPDSTAHYFTLRACEVLGAAMFLTSMPWWGPATWWALVAGSATLRHLYVQTARFKALPKDQRRLRLNITLWIFAACIGSGAFLMFASGNMPVVLLLGIYMMGSAALLALRVGGDVLRAAGAVTLVMAPISLRLIYEGASAGDVLLTLIGIGGVLLNATIIFTTRFQEANLLRQFELRQRAERAADAVASIGLAKSRFFAAVSHDLRQPVHAIGLYLDPLTKLAQAAHDEPARRAAEGIRQSWRALDDLLSQVLDLTRMDSGALQAQVQAVELAPLVRDLVMQHSATAERAGIRVVALVPAGRWAAADALMLKRVLSNLLDNALKFSPPGRSVVVALRSKGDCWQLQVRDAGPGIALEAQTRIFEEFVQLGNTARDRHQGLGLGLAIARRFTLLMGGSIALRSAPGKGCIFTVTLQKAPAAPLLIPDEPDDSPTWPHASLPAYADSVPAPLYAQFPQSADVLLVEDDALVSAAMGQLLQSWGLQVRHAETAEQALSQADFGQIAICDVRLPGARSGLDVALQLRARGKKVLLISGETDPAVRATAQSQGLTLLIKPVSSGKLRAALQNL